MPELVCCCGAPHPASQRRIISDAEYGRWLRAGLIYFCSECTEQTPDGPPGGIVHADIDAGFCLTCVCAFRLGPGLVPDQCPACAGQEAFTQRGDALAWLAGRQVQ
jgi:hypothetical protein